MALLCGVDTWCLQTTLTIILWHLRGCKFEEKLRLSWNKLKSFHSWNYLHFTALFWKIIWFKILKLRNISYAICRVLRKKYVLHRKLWFSKFLNIGLTFFKKLTILINYILDSLKNDLVENWTLTSKKSLPCAAFFTGEINFT